MFTRLFCLCCVCCQITSSDSLGTADKANAQLQRSLELVLDLEPQKIKIDSGLFAGEIVSPGRASILNNSDKDVTIQFNVNPAEFLLIEVFDKSGRIANELYMKRYWRLYENMTELKIPKGKKVDIAGVDVEDLLLRAKLPPGTYKVIGHYKTNDLVKLTSKEVTFVFKVK